ncbi:peptidase S74 family domain-containing protein [Rhizobium gallicum]|uniref:Peptidase S74 family domain-containing protein n=1 Tax=Rhizobium gallicum TaxID=56730 RepID=A0A1L5NHA8_9HYPH|nr:tail fiber domain-containing protein [Rhizobium gallicum]APO67254.1 peptidase S74 family domain-containing protein [Rhizobium gallicum]
MVELAATIFADGPSADPSRPMKPLIRDWGTWLEQTLLAFTSGAGSILKTSRAALFADLAHNADTSAWVMGDPTAAYNGIYKKNGASGTGSWTRISDLPFSFIIASDIGAGTPNAILATTSIPVSGSALVWMNIFEANTASPVTVSFNGGSTLTIKTNSGDDVEPGGLVSGMVLLGIVSGSTFRLLSDQAISQSLYAARDEAEAAQTAAEAARDIAAGYASDAVSQGNVPIYGTVVGLSSLSVPIGINLIRLNGYYAAGDGGGAMYAKLGAVPSPVEAWHKQSADGAWWEITAGQDIHVEMFGAVRRTADDLIALSGGPILDGDEPLNEAAFQNAHDFVEAKGGGNFYGLGNVYLFGDTGWRYGRAVKFRGAGHGKWMPSFPTEAKTWEGTNLIPRRTGTRDYTARGITSCELSGGWRNSLDTPGRVFKLLSFMNRDASVATPATPRAMSVFIAPKERGQDKGAVEACRIVPWIGADGISTYSTQSGSDLGADWDIALLLDTVEGFHVSDVQVRGYWRMIGIAEVSPDFEDWSRSEANIFINSSATGFVGMAIRSGSQYKIQATSWNGSTGTVTIPWDAENPFPSTGGQISLINSGYVTYTSTTRSGSNLVFNGLTVDPTGNSLLRNPYRGTGFSTGAFINCEAWALWHHSGQKAEALGFPGPSEGFQVSGFPMRGLNFFNFSAFGEDSVSPAVHLHNCFDFNFFGGKAEIGIVLASPIESLQDLPTTAAGSTNNLGLHGFQFTSSIDKRSGYWHPRSVRDLQGQWNPLDELLSETFMLKALENQEFWLKMAASKNFRIKKSDGTDALTIFSSGSTTIPGAVTIGSGATGLLSSVSGFGLSLREGTTARLQILATSGSVTPGEDNTQNLGTGSLRWAQLFAGTATINTSDERLKREIEAITELVLDAWGDIEWCQYRFTDGERLHFGLVAQRVKAALEKHGLEAFELGLLCYDEWGDVYEDVYEEREVLVPLFNADGIETGEYWKDVEIVPTGEKRLATPAGNRYGLRYEECFAVEVAYQRRRMDRIEAKLTTEAVL